MKCTRFGEERCNCSCFEIDQEMDAILLTIAIVYGACRIVIESVQQCTYFLFSVNLLLVGVIYEKEPCKFAVNKRQNTNYSFLSVTSKVSCIRRKRGQIICLQGNNKLMVISFSKGEKWYDKLFNVKYLPLFHHFKAIYHFQNIYFFLVKIVANASLNCVCEIYRWVITGKGFSFLKKSLKIPKVQPEV